ncbi:hypothetical protein PRNP1_000993 [Phytophthora ramorum]
MNRYPLAPRPLSDSLVGLVRPRAPTGRHQGDGPGLATPFQAAVSPYTSIKIEVPRAPIHDHYSAAGDALLSLTGVEVGGSTAEKPHSTSRTEMKLQRIESVAPGVMTARAKLSVTTTEFTLRHAFPHLEKPICGRNSEDGRGLLYERMLGKRLDFNFSLNFLIDEDSDRSTQFAG